MIPHFLDTPQTTPGMNLHISTFAEGSDDCLSHSAPGSKLCLESCAVVALGG